MSELVSRLMSFGGVGEQIENSVFTAELLKRGQPSGTDAFQDRERGEKRTQKGWRLRRRYSRPQRHRRHEGQTSMLFSCHACVALRLRLRLLDRRQPRAGLCPRHLACRHAGSNGDRRCVPICLSIPSLVPQFARRRCGGIVAGARISKTTGAKKPHTTAESNASIYQRLDSSFVAGDHAHALCRACRFHAFGRRHACARLSCG